MDSLITAKDLTYRVNNQTIFHGLDFEILQGEYVGLMGENGAGKTTLMQILMGLIKPTSGDFSWSGGLSGSPRMGYVPQYHDAHTNFPATVRELIHGVKNDSNVYQELLQKHLPINHLYNQLFSSLSGGQKQLVHIYRSLLSNPEILFLDEPTSALDVSHQKQFYQLLGELNKNHKMTIIFVTHDIDAVAYHANRVLCLCRKSVDDVTESIRVMDETHYTVEHIH
jgi:ABC-type Mn2+/Zn2+ transport system ATPase subunit